MTLSRPPQTDKYLSLARLPRPAGNFISLTSLAQILALPVPSARVAAKRLEKKGILARVGPALYANFFAEPSVEQLAGLLKSPSYISLEWALAQEGLSAQKPHELTCVTLQRPGRSSTPLGSLSYSHLTRSLFFGFRQVTLPGGAATWIAEPEKALLDWIYLRRRAGEPIALDELDLRPCRAEVLRRYARAFPPFVQAAVNSLAA